MQWGFISNVILAICVAFVDAQGKLTFYDLPIASGPCGIGEGPDNKLWIQAIQPDDLVQLNAKTGGTKTFHLANGAPVPQTRSSTSCAVVTGYDGLLYVTNSRRRQLVQFNVTSEVVKLIDFPSSANDTQQAFVDMTAAPDGLYLSLKNPGLLAKFNYKTGKFNKLDFIHFGTTEPRGIYYAPDGAVYFVVSPVNRLGAIIPGKHPQIAVFEVQVPGGVASLQTIGSEVDKRYLYLTAVTGNAITIYDTRTKKFEVFKGLTGGPADTCLAADGNVWFTEVSQTRLSRFDVTHKSISEFPVTNGTEATAPPPKQFENVISCGPGKAVWGMQTSINRVYRLALG